MLTPLDTGLSAIKFQIYSPVLFRYLSRMNGMDRKRATWAHSEAQEEGKEAEYILTIPTGTPS